MCCELRVSLLHQAVVPGGVRATRGGAGRGRGRLSKTTAMTARVVPSGATRGKADGVLGVGVGVDGQGRAVRGHGVDGKVQAERSGWWALCSYLPVVLAVSKAVLEASAVAVVPGGVRGDAGEGRRGPRRRGRR